VQLVCGQRVVCNRYVSFSGRSQQHQQLQHHAQRHLQREVHWNVEKYSTQLNSKLINTFIKELMLLFFLEHDAKKVW